MKNLHFEDVCDFMKEKDTQILEKANRLLDIILILGAGQLGGDLFVDPNSIGLLASLIEIKNEVSSLVLPFFTDTFMWVTKQKPNTPVEYEQQMVMAYVLISYSAFFEALEEKLPDLLNDIEIQGSDKFRIAQYSNEESNTQDASSIDGKLLQNTYSTDFSLTIPHPTDSFEPLEYRLTRLYNKLGEGFERLLHSLAVWDDLSQTEKDRVTRVIKSLPELAVSHFKAQYYRLAVLFPEFYVWASLNGDDEIKNSLNQQNRMIEAHHEDNISQFKELVNHLTYINDSVDVGFEKLEIAISKVIETNYVREAEHAFRQLRARYLDDIDQPIASDDGDQDEVQITYPKRSEIFVPQSFKVIRYKDSPQLENENTWRQTTHTNLGPFIVSYLQSSHSFYTPLIILGHPGSGKSMLTRFIAAKVQGTKSIPIRIELRNAQADLKIRDQILERIHDITGSTVTWPQLLEWLDSEKLLVIFDGYDELLQVTGKVFSNYLEEIASFQSDTYKYDNQPIQVIVTSRITLIDKARIPDRATVMRLQPFDSNQRSKWIEIWNRFNRNYFESHGYSIFKVSERRQVLELAEQPLLLLMLAIYDSDGNKLQNNADVSRTALYSDLINRFVDREERKDKNQFDSIQKEVSQSVIRLGAIAISMFNRRALDINSKQLDSDIKFFRLEKADSPHESKSGGWELSQGQKAIGSFFFVHQSEARSSEGSDEEIAKKGTYEFLHNTFGEFLTADFILKQSAKEIEAVHAFKTTEALKHKLPELLANDRAKEWYASLIYTPLFSRPVILQMLREWRDQIVKNTDISLEDFLASLKDIVNAELDRILNNNNFPKLMIEMQTHSFPSWSLLGHAAIYSVNLILLQTVLNPSQYVWQEEYVQSSPDGANAWDRLIYLWRSWFSLDTLYQITAILNAKRENNTIKLTTKSDFATETGLSQLNKIRNLSYAIADDTLFSLSSFLLDGNQVIQYVDDLEDALRYSDLFLDMRIKFLTLQLNSYPEYMRSLSFTHEIDKTIDLSVLRNGHYSGDYFVFFDSISVALRQIYESVPLDEFVTIYNEVLRAGSRLIDGRINSPRKDAIIKIIDIALEYPIGDQVEFLNFCARELTERQSYLSNPKFLRKLDEIYVVASDFNDEIRHYLQRSLEQINIDAISFETIMLLIDSYLVNNSNVNERVQYLAIEKIQDRDFSQWSSDIIKAILSLFARVEADLRYRLIDLGRRYFDYRIEHYYPFSESKQRSLFDKDRTRLLSPYEFVLLVVLLTFEERLSESGNIRIYERLYEEYVQHGNHSLYTIHLLLENLTTFHRLSETTERVIFELLNHFDPRQWSLKIEREVSLLIPIIQDERIRYELQNRIDYLRSRRNN